MRSRIFFWLGPVAIASAIVGAAELHAQPAGEDDRRDEEEKNAEASEKEAEAGAPEGDARLQELERALRKERRAREELEARLERAAERSAERAELMRELEEVLRRERKARTELEKRLEEAETSRSEMALEHEYLSQRLKEVVEDYPAQTLEEPERVTFGGALWFNYAFRSFSERDRDRGGELGFDLFRLTADGSLGGVLLSAQYRFYPFMQALHHAWFGYAPRDDLQLRLGVDQVPFGLLPYASHSYWFGVPYYLGLEDSYKTGARAIYSGEPWNVQLAAFAGSAPAIGEATSRYSFAAIAPEGDPYGNEELGQLNARAAYVLSGDAGSLELGASGQWARLEHGLTGERGSQWAGALHANAFAGGWNAQLQLARYAYEPAGENDELVTLAAFGATRAVASRGAIFVANLAKKLPAVPDPLDEVTCYENWSSVLKDRDAFASSWLSTTGCLLKVGPLYSYIDAIVGKNMTFLGDSATASGLGRGGADHPEVRLNVNLEYFF